VRFVVTDRDLFNSVHFGIELGSALGKLFPGKMNWTADEKLVGDKVMLGALGKGEDPRQIESKIEPGIRVFLERRASFLLY
jgi:hypothetical protein